MKEQVVSKHSTNEQLELYRALYAIGNKVVINGKTEFTEEAKELQKVHHSSISILKKLRQTKIIVPYSKVKNLS
jgi:hypothetical protein